MVSFWEVPRWDEHFFGKFSAFRNGLYAQDAMALVESLESLQAQFGPEAPFSKHNEWRAILAVDERGEPLGRIVASYPRPATTESALNFVPCGYYEAVDSLPVAEVLFSRAERFALSMRERFARIERLKGPIQGNFFNSYRLKLDGKEEDRFFGEPHHPAYYHAHFSGCGFKPSGIWETVEITFEHLSPKIDQIWKRFHQDAGGLPGGERIRIRPARMAHWNEDLKIIHSLFADSYAAMPDFMPISFEEFEALYGDFRHLIRPDLVFFVEQSKPSSGQGEEGGGKPVAFLISYFDPLPVLLKHQRAGWPAKVLTLLRLRFNRSRMLIPYVGKTSAAGVKGVAAAMGRQLVKNAIRYRAHRAFACFLAEGSPSYATLPSERRTIARYVLYQKPLVS